MGILKTLKKKIRSSSTKVLKEKNNEIVTSQTSESTTEDCNSPNLDNDSTLSSGSGDHIRSREVLLSQQSDTILEEGRIDSERNINEKFSPGSAQYSINDVVSHDIK